MNASDHSNKTDRDTCFPQTRTRWRECLNHGVQIISPNPLRMYGIWTFFQRVLNVQFMDFWILPMFQYSELRPTFRILDLLHLRMETFGFWNIVFCWAGYTHAHSAGTQQCNRGLTCMLRRSGVYGRAKKLHIRDPRNVRSYCSEISSSQVARAESIFIERILPENKKRKEKR